MKKIIFFTFFINICFAECESVNIRFLADSKLEPIKVVFDKIKSDLELDSFYKKKSSVKGILILSSDKVSQDAHSAAERVIEMMLKNNSAITKKLVEEKASINIFSDDEKVSDLPEMRSLKGSKTFDGRDRDDICGTGGVPGRTLTTICEKNLLKKSNDPYFGKEDICTHEFAHTIMNVGFSDEQKLEVEKLYQMAKSKNLYRRSDGKTAYEMEDSQEFFAVLSGIWFKSFDKDSPIHSPELSDRESIKKTFPEMYQFLQKIYQ